MGQSRLFALILMEVEGELLKEISENPKFYDAVLYALNCKQTRMLINK